MKYVIYGASLETGADCKVIVEAATPMDATEQAQAMRIAVNRVEIEEPAIPVTLSGTVLTERTAKPIKRQMQQAALGMLVALGGCVMAPKLGGRDYGGVIVIGCTLLLIASLVYYCVARYKAWWHHG